MGNETKQKKNAPVPVVDLKTLTRANYIGLSLFFLLGLSAVVVYGVLWLMGVESSIVRVLVAVFAGPLVVGLVVLTYWERVLGFLKVQMDDVIAPSESATPDEEVVKDV